MSTITNLRTWLAKTAILLAMGCTALGSRIVYVDVDANGVNDGSSWTNAYKYLQDALADANSTDGLVQICVAKGIYTPDNNSAYPNGSGDREATFHLINGVALKGGYAGFGAPNPNVRDINEYETILSGDLAGNDVDVNDPTDLRSERTRTENSCHVVSTSGTDATAILDGFTITGGHDNSWGYIGLAPPPIGCGGGMLIRGGSPKVVSCTFLRNYASAKGGGMCNQCSSPTVINCTFRINSVTHSGAGISNTKSNPLLVNCVFLTNTADFGSGAGMVNQEESRPTVTNCVFSNNWARWCGGGVYNIYSNPIFNGCLFMRNRTRYTGGGGMFNKSSNPVLNNCLFKGNSTDYHPGGGMSNEDSGPTLNKCGFIGNAGGIERQSLHAVGGGVNNSKSTPVFTSCSFIGNSAGKEASGSGGAISSICSDLTLRNCTFAGNVAARGCALSCYLSRGSRPSNFMAANCILWDGGEEFWSKDGSTIALTHTDIQGGLEGEGNIDIDPLFANPGYWADVNDTSVIVEPNDPNAVWIDGDYHLKSQAGRWDPTTESWIKDDVTSPCIDTGDPNSPIDFEPFPNGGVINMGAYGGTAEASKSYFGEPVCETIVAGDINGDCKVDFSDFAIMALHWLENNTH